MANLGAQGGLGAPQGGRRGPHSQVLSQHLTRKWGTGDSVMGMEWQAKAKSPILEGLWMQDQHGRHGNGMTVLALQLCFSHELGSDCIFCVHMNTRSIVLQHCVPSCPCGRSSLTHRRICRKTPPGEVLTLSDSLDTMRNQFLWQKHNRGSSLLCTGTRFKHTFYFKCMFQFTSGSVSPVNLSVHGHLQDLCKICSSSIVRKVF